MFRFINGLVNSLLLFLLFKFLKNRELEYLLGGESILGLISQTPPDDLLNLRIDFLWENQLQILFFMNINPLKRRPLEVQLIDQKPKTPNIHLITLGLSFNNFWTHILSGPTNGPPQLIPAPLIASEPKVAELDGVGLVYQNIFGFDVPMEDVFGVNELDCLGGLIDQG